MTRNELIAALREAKGPSRELDLVIQQSIRKAVIPRELRHLESANNRTAFHDSNVHETGYCLGQLPAYTASLDAAMTLVPPDCLAGIITGHRPFAEVQREDKATQDFHFMESEAATPILCLVICALLARSPAAGKDDSRG